ncbi:TPA: DUF3037 domain-containing protein [Neisseria gonorrhoeae]
MNRYAMRFAVIRFMPYVQTREFANIGIIITHPQSGCFDFKIEHRYSRLSRFFRRFDLPAYKAATRAFEKELQRIRNLAAHSAPDQIRAMPDHLTRPREALIMAARPGVTLAPGRGQELNRLFDYFVARSFAKNQPEAELTRQIQAMSKPLQTAYPFKESTIGDPSGFHASIPLVQKAENGEIRKIIKPIYFGRKDPADIYYKSDKRIADIKRLRRGGYIDRSEILFAYEPPERPDKAQEKALLDVSGDLEEQGIQLADNRSEGKIIRNFACG